MGQVHIDADHQLKRPFGAFFHGEFEDNSDDDKQHDKFHDRHIFTNHKDEFVHVEEMQF